MHVLLLVCGSVSLVVIAISSVTNGWKPLIVIGAWLAPMLWIAGALPNGSPRLLALALTAAGALLVRTWAYRRFPPPHRPADRL